MQCIHDHPWTVQGWRSSQAQDPLGKVTQEYNVSTTIHGQSKDVIAARLKTLWQSNSGIQCIHDHPWTVQGWHSKPGSRPPGKVTQEFNVSTTIHGQSKDGIVARFKTPWQSNSGMQCIHDHPWTVQGWHSSQAQDPLAK